MVLCVEEYPGKVGDDKGEDIQATGAAEDEILIKKVSYWFSTIKVRSMLLYVCQGYLRLFFLVEADILQLFASYKRILIAHLIISICPYSSFLNHEGIWFCQLDNSWYARCCVVAVLLRTFLEKTRCPRASTLRCGVPLLKLLVFSLYWFAKVILLLDVTSTDDLTAKDRFQHHHTPYVLHPQAATVAWLARKKQESSPASELFKSELHL